MNADAAKEINKLPRTLCKKRHAGPGRKGEVDLTGCSHGYRIELEGKIYPNKPTRIQKHRMKKWGSAGAIVGVYFSKEEAVEIVLQGLKDRGVNLKQNKHLESNS